MEDTLYTITCPACGKRMTKVRIKELDMFIDICTEGCGGVFFDNQEVKKIKQTKIVLEKLLQYFEGKTFTPVDKTKVRICPTCKAPMVKMGSKAGLKIDVCHVCGGEFYDNDEIIKLQLH